MNKLSNTLNGIVMMALGIILAILYFALPTFLVYIFWIAIIILILYGVYLFQKR